MVTLWSGWAMGFARRLAGLPLWKVPPYSLAEGGRHFTRSMAFPVFHIREPEALLGPGGGA